MREALDGAVDVGVCSFNVRWRRGWGRAGAFPCETDLFLLGTTPSDLEL